MYHHPVGHLKGAPGPILQRARRALHWLGAQRAAQGGRQAPVRSGCGGTPSAGPPRACKEPTGCCVPGAHWVSVAPPRWTPQGRPRNPLAACQARTGVGGRSAQGDGDVNQVRARRPHWQRASRAFVGWEATRKGRVTTSNSQVRVWRHPFSWTPQVRAWSTLAGCVPGAYWQRTQRARETANSQARVLRHPAGHLRGEPGTNQLAAYQARTGWGGVPQSARVTANNSQTRVLRIPAGPPRGVSGCN